MSEYQVENPSSELDEQERVCHEEVLRSLNILNYYEQPMELRCLQNDGPPVSGVFNDMNAMALYAATSETAGRAVYFGLNPISGKKATNEVSPGRATCGDDVTRRQWLLIDCDPIRSANSCASKAEKKAAKNVAGKVIQFLKKQALLKKEWEEIGCSLGASPQAPGIYRFGANPEGEGGRP